jgi:hypothetical protein
LVEPELTTQRYLLDLLLDAVDGNTCQIKIVTFCCFTEHKRGDHIYRAHPDYRKGGPWYDWAYVPAKRVTFILPKFGFLSTF